MILEQFSREVTRLIASLAVQQQAVLEDAAQAVSDAISNHHSVFAFGCSHSGLLVQEIYYRAGGLMLVNPLFGPGMNLAIDPPLLTSDMERVPGLAARILDNSALGSQDLLVVVSSSGRNAVPVEMAEGAKRRGASVVAVTSLAYTQAVASAAPSGRRLFEVADWVLDNGAPLGDAVLEIPGLDAPMGPVSTITGAFLLQALMAMAAERLVAKGVDVPVFRSGNIDGARARNEAVFQQYAAQIHYRLR